MATEPKPQSEHEWAPSPDEILLQIGGKAYREYLLGRLGQP